MNRKYIIYHLGRYFKKKNRQKEYPDINNSSNWIFKEHEIHEQDESFKYRVHKESDFSLGDLLSIIFSINRNDLQFLDVCENESMKNIRDKEDIWSYDILKPYANIKTDENSFPDIFYNIKYNKNKDSNNAEATSGVIMFHTSYAGEYKNSTRYINIVICSSLINTKKHNHNDKDSNCAYKNLTIAYDFKDPSKALTEYSFLRETINRYNNNIEKYLTDNEWKLLETMDINIGAEFYWGKKAFIENRYLDAILYFKNVYRYMRDRWYKNGLNVSEMSLLTECAFLIGYSYNDMKQYDKAYSYLELAGRSNNLQYKYKKEFINCLVNSKNLL